MKGLRLQGIKNVLCLGADSDDIEIGCGATIRKLTQEQSGLAVWWVVFTADGKRQAEAKNSARAFLQDAGRSYVIIRQFRNGYFPFEGAKIKDYFESLKSRVKPDLIFTHFRDDRHQDHRLLSDLTWNMFRSNLVSMKFLNMMEIWVRPIFSCNSTSRLAEEKVDNLRRFFSTQSNKHWFGRDTFLALMRLRGIECCEKYCRSVLCPKNYLRLRFLRMEKYWEIDGSCNNVML